MRLALVKLSKLSSQGLAVLLWRWRMKWAAAHSRPSNVGMHVNFLCHESDPTLKFPRTANFLVS
jgi:hypothetical protein